MTQVSETKPVEATFAPPPKPAVTPDSEVGAGAVPAEQAEKASVTALGYQLKAAQEQADAQKKEHARNIAAADDARKSEVDRLQEIIKKQQADLVKKADAVGKAAGKKEGEANSSRASTKARWAIVIEEARDSTETTYVDVGANGRAYRMQRGVVVDVPPEVIGVLKDAVVGRAVPIVNEQGISAGVTYRNGRRFPFRILGRSVDAQGVRIKTFTAERDSDFMG